MSISLSEAGAERTIMVAGFSHTQVWSERSERGERGSEVMSPANNNNEQNLQWWVSVSSNSQLSGLHFQKQYQNGWWYPPHPARGAVHPHVHPLNSGQLWLRREVGCRLEIHFQISFRSVSDWSKCTAQQRGPLWLQGKHLVRWIWCVEWGCKV